MNGKQKAAENIQEWEMANHQRGLVDDIVEEGQYEAAIEILLQLRSPQYKPSISHTQQLIFLALHPTDIRTNAPVRTINETPRKTRSTKASSSISPKAIVSALNLLTSLSSTNSPEALGRALPSYNVQDQILEEPMDSLLAKQALCIKSAKHCWELLEEGFVFRNQVVISPKGKSKLRRDYSIDEIILSETPSRGPTVVSDDAWPFLDWIVSFFERDEYLREQNEELRYSALFLEQLPPPRGDSPTRWNFSIILNVVLYTLGQPELRRKMIGYRLMKLLINLTNTIHVELSMLVNSVHKSLLVAWNDPQRIQDFLSGLGSAASAQRFKIGFCQQLLNGTKMPATLLQPTNIRPRPQARVAPKPRVGGTSDGPKDHVEQNPQQIASRHVLLTCTEILHNLDFSLPKFLPPTNPSLILFARFQLINSFAALQGSQPPELRLEWDRLIQEGKLAESLKRGFPQDLGDEASLYSRMLRESLRIPL